MKKIITLMLMALLLLPAQQAVAQGFLKKALNKAKAAMTSKTTNDEAEEEEEVTETNSQSASRDSDDDGGMMAASAKDQLQPKRQSTLTWDEAVVPSTASSAEALMKELPDVPTVAQLVEPDEDAQIVYYRAIKKVVLRAEGLNEEATCDDEYTKQWRAKANKLLKDLGLTDADIAALENDNLSEAERERISQKLAKSVLGDFDMSSMNKMEKMDENAMIQQMTSKTDAVYDKYDAQLRKYTGIPAAEYKKASAMAAANPAAADKQMDALSKRAAAYGKQQSANNPQFEKEAQAFGQKLSAELMEAQRSSSPMGGGMGNLNDLINNANQLSSKMASVQQTQQAMMQYVNKIRNLVPDSEVDDADVSFAASERKKIEDLKKQIYATDNAGTYNPLYLQALEMIKTYRQRAAKVWRDDLVNRINQLKKAMPEAISLQRQAIKDELIPECALWRVPLNLVIRAGDVLSDAYAEFPSTYPPMYNEEVTQTIKLPNSEGFMYPESQVATSVDEALRGRGIYRSVGEDFYEWDNGSWKSVDYKTAMDEIKKVQKPESASWTSQDGKRVVRFNSEGGYIALPEGNEISPRAWTKDGNSIIWVDYRISEDEATGTETMEVVKCTYKL
ncbi:MAG: hypothetical protein K5856_07840 [Bacteroidaceae bacterium]|nr:hypothetical protein [Bacteroidaceae bacterium]